MAGITPSWIVLSIEKAGHLVNPQQLPSGFSGRMLFSRMRPQEAWFSGKGSCLLGEGEVCWPFMKSSLVWPHSANRDKWSTLLSSGSLLL